MHTVSGDVLVSRSVLPEGEAGVDATVLRMAQLAHSEWGSKSPKIRALAMNIVQKARVTEKDYYGEIVAIHNWIKNPNNIRYFRDPVGQETLADPEQTAFNLKGGDCLAGHTRLLTPSGYKKIADIKTGDTVLGRNGWAAVTNWWDKGILPTKRYHISTGGEVEATGDHKWLLSDGSEKRSTQLVIGDTLLGAPSIDKFDGDCVFSDADLYFFGLYLADGWEDEGRLCIAGKDGHPKEMQKKWVEQYAISVGLTTSWHPRYIRVMVPKDHKLRLVAQGKTAIDKTIPDELFVGLTPQKAQHLILGLFSDSHQPKERRSGRCYSTISSEMAQQMRILLRLCGFSCRITRVDDHGGLGINPIYRVYPRFYRNDPPKLQIVTDSGNQHVYDIETSDHGIYLPDADIVVHNCDDKTVLEMALLGAIGIPTYPVVVGQQKGSFCHVYLHAVVPPGKHRMANQVVPLDPIMRYWAAGVEAKNVKAKKTYPQFANPLRLQGNNMSGLGAYAVGPSYLDQDESHASKLLVPDKRDCYTYEDGSVANSTRATQRMEGIDSLMGLGAVPPTGGYFTETSAGGRGTIATSDGQLVPRGFMRTEPSTAEIMDMTPATPSDLGPRGPIFARRAKEETELMPRIHAEAVPTLSRRLAAGGLPVASTPQTVGLKRYDVPGVQRALEQRNLTGRPYRNQFLRGQKTVSVQPMNIERLGKEAKPVSLGEELADYEYTHTEICGMLGAWAQKMNRGPVPMAQRENAATQIRALIQERDNLERRILEIKQKLRGMQPQKLIKDTVRSNAVVAQIPSASFEQNDLMLRPSGGISTTVSGMGGFTDVIKSPFVYAPAALLVGIALFKLLRPKRR